MAAVDVVSLTLQSAGTVLSGGGRRINIITSVDPGGAVGPTLYYRMRARDANSVGLQYRYWLVENEPDGDASEYNGTYAGASPNFVDITVIETFNYQPVVD